MDISHKQALDKVPVLVLLYSYMKLGEVIEQIKKVGSYLVTVTAFDKKKEEGNLTHYIFREQFPTDDIVPSLDQCVRLLGIERKESTPEVIRPPKKEGKPLRIAIITHFNRCEDGYSPARAVRNQIKLLKRYNHNVVFFCAEGSSVDFECETRRVVPRFKRQKGIVDEKAKQRTIEMLEKELVGFDLAITHDFFIDDCITYREAIKECKVDIKWLHWARSGVGHPIDFAMPNARYVNMNFSDAGIFASRINVPINKVRVIFNEKDAEWAFSWHPLTTQISNKLRLWEKQIVETLPICTTRQNAKGVDSVIRVFGELKAQGNRVALIICNSNAKNRQADIDEKVKFGKECGLDENDLLYVSTLGGPTFDLSRGIPYQVVMQLFQISNLFVFPTIAEVCSNAILEAAMAKNLLVLNQSLPSLADFVERDDVIFFPFSSNQNVDFSGRRKEEIEKLAKEISRVISSNSVDHTFRYVWSRHSSESIYYNMLAPILYE